MYGLFKTEVIRQPGPWRTVEAVACAARQWVDGLDNRRLPAPIGNVPPSETTAGFHAALDPMPITA